MKESPFLNEAGVIGAKYCGSGHGGYILYIFETPEYREQLLKKNSDFIAIEPYCRLFGDQPI